MNASLHNTTICAELRDYTDMFWEMKNNVANSTMMSNMTLDRAYQVYTGDTTISTTVSVALLLSSLLIAGCGGRFIVPVILFGVFSTILVLTFVLLESSELSCFAQILGSLGFAALCAVLAKCSLNAAITFMGGVAAAGFTHMLFKMNLDFDHGPIILSRSSSYWVVLIASVTIGACLARRYMELSFEILTSLFGGSLFAYALNATLLSQSIHIHRNNIVSIGILVSIMGVVGQRTMRLRRKKKPTKKEVK